MNEILAQIFDDYCNPDEWTNLVDELQPHFEKVNPAGFDTVGDWLQAVPALSHGQQLSIKIVEHMINESFLISAASDEEIDTIGEIMARIHAECMPRFTLLLAYLPADVLNVSMMPAALAECMHAFVERAGMMST